MSISIPDRVLFRDLEGEAVILHLDTGQYYGLNAMGTHMWHLLEEHGSVGKAFEVLKGSYRVAEDLLLRDLTSFVQELARRNLLQADAS